jgi:hypothetical protein
MTMHLLLHLHAQIQLHGAVSYSSMFPFEAQFMHFKRLIQGTLGHGEQICEKFLLSRILRHYLMNNGQRYNNVLSALQLRPRPDLDNKLNLIDGDRSIKDGVIYHTSKYGKRRGSVSCYCLLQCGTYIEITAFIKENERIICKGRIFDVVSDVFTYLLTELFFIVHQDNSFQLYVCLSVLIFFLLILFLNDAFCITWYLNPLLSC